MIFSRVLPIFFTTATATTTTTTKSRKIQENNPKNSKNPRFFENFPVDPGRSLGYPGRPTGKFSKILGVFENVGFFFRILLDFSSSSSSSSSSSLGVAWGLFGLSLGLI